MKINSSNINFNGFRNVITHDVSSPPSDIHLLVAQLNNEGKDDLSAFRILGDMDPMLGIKKDDDILVSFYIKSGNYEKLFLNDGFLPLCDDLYSMKARFKPQYFAKKEAATMKGLTFICDLTNRIRNTGLISNDEGFDFVYVIEKALQHFECFFKNKDAAFSFLEAGILTNKKPGKVAEKINAAIAKSMNRYFL